MIYVSLGSAAHALVSTCRRVCLAGPIAVVLLSIALVVPTGASATVPPPASVSLVSSAATVTVPDGFTLTATTSSPVDGSGHWIKIFDADENQLLIQCSGGSTCTYYAGAPWWDNRSRTRHFIARVGTYAGDVISSTSETVEVAIEKYEFDASISASPTAITIPGSYTVTASTTRDVAESRRYWLKIIDAETNNLVTQCSSGLTCEYVGGAGWAENANPKSRRFLAKVGTYYGDEWAGASSEITVTVRRRIFQVSLAFSDRTVGQDGKTRFVATAASTPSVVGTPYRLTIRSTDPTAPMVALCTTEDTCSASVAAGYQYWATVEDYGGTSFGASSRFDLTSSGATSPDSVGGVDLATLAAAFANSSEICIEIGLAPGSHVEGSSLNDAALACEEAKALGLSANETVRRVIAAGGATVAAWLSFTTSLDDSELPTAPPGTTPPPPYRSEVPTTLPRTFDAPVASTAATLRMLNPELVLTDAHARAIARQCLWLAAQAEMGLGPCSQDRLPIFVTGSTWNDKDIAAASQHDLEALGRWPLWLRLNYEQASLKETRTNRRWYRTDPDCDGSGAGTGNDCDEFPFFSTEQGGKDGILRTGRKPDLKPIASDPNQDQGNALNAFYGACAMRTGTPQPEGNSIGGDPFLVVPVMGIPATSLCNGKSATNQP